MGLDATVMCTCLRDGTITEPPFPREWLTVDDEENVCLKGEHDSDANWRAFDRWMLSCCRHEGMNLACQ
ncbi:hypothetical protein Pan44_02460 [Caulifigura coniformis]|uniref:Uncharacterized protein n=1 Tax=Caulifigura coniformis TaxID=2527983 RepID=A0A517S805_9PLAN|nr:hypothetical protein [Caulifigura coniformis]QDT52237.1 hypothetical protein Pan44_02460 [Caulifigura coniformis]